MAPKEKVKEDDAVEEQELPGRPPVGFGYSGKWEDVEVEAQTLLQSHWDELSEKEKRKVMARTSHHRYDHAEYLRSQA